MSTDIVERLNARAYTIATRKDEFDPKTVQLLHEAANVISDSASSLAAERAQGERERGRRDQAITMLERELADTEALWKREADALTASREYAEELAAALHPLMTPAGGTYGVGADNPLAVALRAVLAKRDVNQENKNG